MKKAIPFTVTADVAGALLGGISRQTIKRMCVRGELEGFALKDRWLVEYESIRRFLEQRRVSPDKE